MDTFQTGLVNIIVAGLSAKAGHENHASEVKAATNSVHSPGTFSVHYIFCLMVSLLHCYVNCTNPHLCLGWDRYIVY